MPNFTSGPWIALKDHTGLWIGAQQPDDKERYGIVADIGRFALKEQAEANAQLIAAAPDMLDALKESIDCIKFLSAETTQAGDERERVLKIIDAVIKKAQS